MTPDIQARLLASAPARAGERAALAVLAVHGRWLRHPGFVLACVRQFQDDLWVDWRIVRRFLSRTPCSEVAHEMLLLAAELALWDSGRRLSESPVLRGLDAETQCRLMDAVGPELAGQRPIRRRR